MKNKNLNRIYFKENNLKFIVINYKNINKYFLNI